MKMNYMEAILQKWGNSIGIRISSNILKALNLKENHIIDLIQEEERIVISKSQKRSIDYE